MGLFITFEGPEGCGKTTQLVLLTDSLRSRGYDVLKTREPGGTPISDRVRSILLDPAYTDMLPTTEFLLFSAARAQHVGQTIRPHLERGGVVLSDRFSDSSIAYQGYGHRQRLELLASITRYATGGLEPDLTLLLDLPVHTGLQRKLGGAGDAWNRMEQKDLDFHQRVREGYLDMAARSAGRWVVIDATEGIEAVRTAITRAVLLRLEPGDGSEGGCS